MVLSTVRWEKGDHLSTWKGWGCLCVCVCVCALKRMLASSLCPPYPLFTFLNLVLCPGRPLISTESNSRIFWPLASSQPQPLGNTNDKV
jgi:hypothetical protein